MAEPVKTLPEVLFLGGCSFPYGDATANVLRGHTLAIQGAGLSVGVLPCRPRGREEDRQPDGSYAYRGMPYWPVRRVLRTKPTLVRIYLGLRRHFGLDDDALLWLSARKTLAGLRAIIVYPYANNSTPLVRGLRRLCRREGIKLFIYFTEWREPRHSGFPHFSFGTVDGEQRPGFVDQTFDGVICISEYLQNFYRARGCRTVLIPPLVDPSDPMWCHAHESALPKGAGEVRLVFSGTWVRDAQDVILRGLLEARRRGAGITLDYIGPVRSDMVRRPGVDDDLLNALGNSVIFHGRLPLEETLKISASASFGLFLREDAQWSRACFPSKVPEFLSLGVPLMCNLTTDLGRYLADSQNAILVEGVSVEAFTKALLKAAAMGRDHYEKMRAEVRRTAVLFDAARYSGTYRDLIGPRTATPLEPDQP